MHTILQSILCFDYSFIFVTGIKFSTYLKKTCAKPLITTSTSLVKLSVGRGGNGRMYSKYARN